MAFSETAAWKALSAHLENIQATHLRDLLQDDARCRALVAEHNGIFLDYCRQKVTTDTMEKLADLAREVGLAEKVRGWAQLQWHRTASSVPKATKCIRCSYG